MTLPLALGEYFWLSNLSPLPLPQVAASCPVVGEALSPHAGLQIFPSARQHEETTSSSSSFHQELIFDLARDQDLSQEAKAETKKSRVSCQRTLTTDKRLPDSCGLPQAPLMATNNTTLWSNGTSLSSSSKAKDNVSSIIDMIQVFLYAVIFLIGSLGNGAVIWITARQVSRTVNCVWFFNLALADFLFSVSRIVPLLKNAFYDGWPFGSFLCRANSFIKYLNMFSSVFLLAAISLDRAISVAYPVWSKNNRGPRLAWLAAIGAWFVATTTSLPFYLYRSVVIEKGNKTKCSLTLGDAGEAVKLTLYLLRLVCGFLAPFAIIVFCYGVIAVTLRRRRATIRSKKPFKVILAIIIVFFLCWAPYHLFLLLKLAKVKSEVISMVLPLTSCLAYLNSCVNPILYFFMGLDFRKELRRFSLAGAFRRTLLEDTVYSLRRHGKPKKEDGSSIDDLDCSTTAHDLVETSVKL